MAIGTVRAQGTPQQYQQPRVSPDAFGAGIATALRGLGANMQKAADAEANRQTSAQKFDADARWATVQGQWQRDQLDAVNAAPESGQGITNSRYGVLEASRKEFLDSIADPELRQRYEATTEVAVQNLTTNMYQAEFTLRNDYENREIGSVTGMMANEVIAGNTDLQGALSTVSEIIESSNLSDVDKVVAQTAAEQDIIGASFHRDLAQAKSFMGPTRDWREGEVVAAGLSGAQEGMLNAIASEESAGSYSVRWSGPGNTPQHFTDFSQHPRIFVDNGHGDVSSAAGRYQITASTWDSLPAKFRQGGFTPENQDRAALYLAELRYNRLIEPTEPNFQQVIDSGTDQELLYMRDALAPTWVAFEHMSDDKFLNIFRGVQGRGGGGTGSPATPNVWTDPAYNNLTVERRTAMQAAANATAQGFRDQEQQQLEDNAESIRISVAAKDPNALAMADSMIANNQVPFDEIAGLLKLVSDDREAQASGMRIMSDITNGVAMGNTTDNQAALLDFYERNGVLDGLGSMSPEAGGVISQAFARSGVMPDEISSRLMAMYNSPDPRQMQYGMQILADMQVKARNQFGAAMPEEIVKATTAWRLATEYSPEGDSAAVFSRFQEYRSPEQRELRALLEEDAEAILAEIGIEQRVDGFRTWFDRMDMQVGTGNLLGMQSRGVEAPTNPQVIAKLVSDGNALFKQYYPLFQDEDRTFEFVNEILGNKWAPDRVGGSNELSYLGITSPMAGYQSLDGTHDWAREDILQSMGWASDQRFHLLADATSEADIRRGEPASYTMTRLLPDGTINAVMNDSGTAPMRIRPTISQEILDITARRQELSNIREGLERSEERLSFLRFEQSTMVEKHGLDSLEVVAASDAVSEEMARLATLKDSRDAVSAVIPESINITALQEELAALKAPVDTSSTTGNLLRGIRRGAGIPFVSDTSGRDSRRIEEIERSLRALGALE